MKRFLIAYFQGKYLGENRASSDIHEVARDYFARGFSNPRRLGCYSSDEYRKLIEDKSLPGEDMRDHLFECSQCFNDYSLELSRSQSVIARRPLF